MSQLLSVIFSIVLWSSPISYRPLIPAMGVIGLTVVALLWLPSTSRRFFHRHRIARSDRAGKR